MAIRHAATNRLQSPARSEVGAQIYNQAINTVMASKFTQGGEKLDEAIKWTENELEANATRLNGSVARRIDMPTAHPSARRLVR
jgi:hypothetical protein